MKSVDFAQAVGTIRVIEKRILSSETLERAYDCEKPLDTLKLLAQNSEYDFAALKKPEGYDAVLRAELQRVFELIDKLSPDDRLTRLLALKYDYHNIKTALKSKLNKVSADGIYAACGKLDLQSLSNLVELVCAGEATDSDPFTVACRDAYSAYLHANDPQYIDISLDRSMLNHMSQLASEIGNDWISEYVRLTIDFYNLRSLMRVRNMRKSTRFLNDVLSDGGNIAKPYFLEKFDKPAEALSQSFYYKYFGDLFQKAIDSYDRNGNYSLLEKLLDNYLLNHIKKAKLIAFGPEVLFGYLLAKENEIRQIRVLMTGKINDMPYEALKERLRDNFA